MKRSRIFLGVTTAILAIAGVAAAKAHRSPSHNVYYYTKHNGSTSFACTILVQTACDRLGTGVNCVYGTKQLYTQFGTINCKGQAKVDIN